MDVAELNAHLKAEIGGFLRNLEAADHGVDDTRRNIERLERTAQEAGRALNDIKVSQAQAYESRAALQSIERSVSSVSHTALLAADHLNEVKVTQTQALETKAATSSIKDDLDEVISRAEVARIALRRVNGGAGGGGGSDGRGILAGLLPGGARARPAALAVAAGAALSTMPSVLPATLGLAAGGAGIFGAIAGGAGVALTALHGISAQAFEDKKAFDALDESQKALVTDLRSLGAGLGEQLSQISETILPHLSTALHEAFTPGTTAAITNDVRAFAEATSQVADEWGRFIGGPFGRELGQMLARDSQYLAPLNREFMHMLDFVVQMLNIGGPFTDWLSHLGDEAARGADEWAHSSAGVHDLGVAFDDAQSGLETLAHLLGGFLDVLGAVYQVTHEGANPAIEVLAGLLREVAAVINDNQVVLANFFNGAVAAAGDVVRVLELLNPLLHDILHIADEVAGGFGGWRTVIDAAAIVFVARFIAMKAGVDGMLAKILLIGPATSGAAAEADAALATLTAAAAEASAALAGIGTAAAEGAITAEAAVAATGASATVAAAEVTSLQATLLGLGGPVVLAALAAAAAGVYGIYESITTQTYPGAAPSGDGSYTYTRDGKSFRVYPGGKPGRGYENTPTDPRDGMRGAYAPPADNKGYYQSLAESDARRYGVPPSLFNAQINQESGFDPTEVSPAGAQGIAQFMPGTAKGMGVNPQDPTSSLDGAARLMASYYRKYKRWDLALAAYNGGPGAVDYYLKHGFYPSSETTNYVNSILGASGVSATTGATSAFSTPGAFSKDTTPKGTIPSGLNLLPTGLATELENAKAAVAAAKAAGVMGSLDGRAPMFVTPGSHPGMVSRGNIDLAHRPVAHNADGSISTVRSISINVDGQEVLIPTVVNGKVVSNQEAIAHYMSTRQNLGTFSSVGAANKYATALHQQQASMYSGGGSAGGSGYLGALQHELDVTRQSLEYLDKQKATGKELVNIAKERAALEGEVSTVTREIAAAQKQQKQDATAAKERSILGIGTDGAEATATVLSLRTRAAAVAKEIATATGQGLDTTDARLEITKLQRVLKFDYIPPDVRQAVANQITALKQTVAQGMAELLAQAKASLADATTAFEGGFGQVSGAADAAFASNVNAHVQNMQDALSQAVNAMQVMVSSPFGDFLFGGGITKTPAQRALAAMQDAHTKAGLDKNLKDAQDAVAAAQAGGPSTLYDAATGITTHGPVDTSAVTDAQQQLADAQYAIDQYNLQKQADAESEAAAVQLKSAQDAYTKEHQAAIVAYQDQQQIVQTAMDQQVAAIVGGMESGKISTADGLEQIKKIWSDAGIDLNGLSFALGGQIYTGLVAGLVPVFALLKDLADSLKRVSDLTGGGAGPYTYFPGAGTESSAFAGGYVKLGTGGIVTTPHWLVDAATGQVTGQIGEAGDEAIVPVGAPGPRPAAAAGYMGGGGTTYAVSVSFNGDVYGADADELAAKITPKVRTELIRIGFANGDQIFGSN